GVAASRWTGGDTWIWVVAVLLPALGSILLRRRFLSVLFLGLAVGALCGMVDNALNASVAPVSGIHRAGGLVRDVSFRLMSRSLVVDLQGCYSGNCCLVVYDETPYIEVGDYIEFTADFKPLEGFRDIDGDNDRSQFYYLNHIGSRAMAVRDSVTVVGADHGIAMGMRRYREGLIDRIVCSGLSDRSQAFLAALILGDDTMLDGDARPRFASTGLAHVLALSGMHVAVIAAILSVLLFPLYFIGLRRVYWGSVIVMLWGYALLTGLSPSVTRAVIMFSMMLMARCIGRFNASANALCFSAILILIFTPRQLFAPGFQLSFLAVSALIVIPGSLPKVSIDSRLGRWCYNYLVYTVSASLGTMLLAAYYFHQVPLLFLFTNLPVSLLLPFILAGGIIIMLLGAGGVSLGFIDLAVDLMCDAVFSVVDWASDIPGVSVQGVWLPLWSVWVGYIAVAMMIAAVYYRRWLPVVSGVALAVITVSMVSLGRDDDDVMFIGRNGDATNIIFTCGDEAYIVTSAPECFGRREAERSMSRYSCFMMERGIDTLHIVPGSSPGNNTEVSFGDKRVLLLNSDGIPSVNDRMDYIIVCRGFRGDIMELIGAVACD
ncbi:MAG: ComEC/Rec2 family competence protein, partial [Muribaculaceae bacterium]|nr:ComEC/Rec2 family competence protein [Muribaculaceae bacterium]